MKRRLLFWVMGLLTCRVWAQSPSPDLRGIYIYTNGLAKQMAADVPALSASFSIPGVDGVAIVVGWGDVEPAMGKYDWTVPDQWIGQVAALGKKIDLVVPAGSYTPSWLFQPPPAGAGATELSFTVSPHDGETGFCESTAIAAPWDPAFLAQWDAMLAALSAHLKSAGTYSAITLVRLTGINRSGGSEELRLPAETAQSSGLACVTDAIATWQQAGYRPSLLLQGWNAVIGSFEKSFPGKSFAVSVIDPPNAFPPIDENGAVIKGTPPDATQPLLLSASQMFPGRLVVQLDFLMPGRAASTEVTNAAQNLGTLAAFQTNEYLGDSGAACAGPNTDPTPCTDTTFLALLETGIYPLGQSNPLRSQYIEVFHDNAAAFPDDILQAHFQLVPPVAPVSTSPGSGSGGNETFTFTFSDSGGYQNLSVVDVLIASALDGRHACYVAFVPSGASGGVYLVDDAGDAGGPYQGLVLPGGGTVSNSQCTISGAGSSASGSGNNLTLTLAITFSASFSGNKVVYTSAGDVSSTNSGWQALGTWGVPGAAVSGPSVSGMSPARTSSLGPTVYTFTFDDTAGFADANSVENILINSAIDGRHACFLAFVVSNNSLLLVDDAGDAAGPYQGLVLPSNGSIANSQCTVKGAGSSVSRRGNSLTLTLSMTYSQSFAGNQVFYLAAGNSTANTGWQPSGSVSVP